MCTQMSKHCMATLEELSQKHVGLIPSKGKSKNQCCGGSIVIKFNGDKSEYAPSHNHKTFVQHLANSVGKPLCLELVSK